ncbi:MAG: hypothetical protein LBD67_00405 [Candidatus Accumulibacter sp.]|nr:hypothetical protein [Accumulibacter sp.]
MFVFNRGVNDEFAKRLNAEYDTCRWWKLLASDTDLFITIRNACIEVYWNGDSLLKIELHGDRIVGEIHYKYLLRHDLPKSALRVHGGTVSFPNASTFFLNDLLDIAALKRAARPYASGGQALLYRIIRSNWNVIDLDIVLGVDEHGQKDKIDFAALRAASDASDGAELVFYVARPFSSPEIRNAGEGRPPVLERIERYRELIVQHARELENVYRAVCKNLTGFYWTWDRYDAVSIDLMHRVAENGPFRINEMPRLIVFDFDNDQRDGRDWAIHRKKLEAALGNRFLLKGEAREFMRGISTGL